MSTSTDTPTICPALHYRDADAAITFLKNAFGFTEHAVHRSDAGVVEHAELKLGSSIVMLSQYLDEGPAERQAADPNTAPITIYVITDDADALHARAVAGGAEIVREVEERPWGSRDFAAHDLDGNAWWFGTYSPYAVPTVG